MNKRSLNFHFSTQTLVQFCPPLSGHSAQRLSSHSPPPHYSLLTTNFRQNSFTSHNKIDFPFPLFLSHFANDIYHTVIGNPTRAIDFMPQQHYWLNNLTHNHWLIKSTLRFQTTSTLIFYSSSLTWQMSTKSLQSK